MGTFAEQSRACLLTMMKDEMSSSCSRDFGEDAGVVGPW